MLLASHCWWKIWPQIRWNLPVPSLSTQCAKCKGNGLQTYQNCYSASDNRIMIGTHLHENSLSRVKSKARSFTKNKKELVHNVHKEQCSLKTKKNKVSHLDFKNICLVTWTGVEGEKVFLLKWSKSDFFCVFLQFFFLYKWGNWVIMLVILKYGLPFLTELRHRAINSSWISSIP